MRPLVLFRCLSRYTTVGLYILFVTIHSNLRQVDCEKNVWVQILKTSHLVNKYNRCLISANWDIHMFIYECFTIALFFKFKLAFVYNN